MGGETDLSNQELPGETTIQSGLLPTPTLDAKYKELLEDIAEAKSKIECASVHSKIEMTEKWLWLFHPNDISLETVYIRTLVRHMNEVSRRQPQTTILFKNSLVEFVLANLSAAQTALEAGDPESVGRALHREDSLLFGGFYLRPQIPLQEEFRTLKDYPNLKFDMTLNQDLSHAWGPTLRWLAFNFILFWLSSLAMMSYQNGDKVFQFPYRFLTGYFSEADYVMYGVLRYFDQTELETAGKYLFAVFMGWAVLYGILVQILMNTAAGRQFPWIINFVHVQLAVIMGVATQYLGSVPSLAGVHQLNYAAVMIIPQLVNGLLTGVCFTALPDRSYKILFRFILFAASFLNAFIISKIYGFRELNPIALALCVLIAAGWCLMINHDRRLMGSLSDITKVDHNSKLSLQGWLFPSIWLLPFVYVGLILTAVVVLAAAIGIGLLILMLVAAVEGDKDKNRRSYQPRRNDALSDGAAEVAAGSCALGGCFAFVILGNLFQVILTEEDQRTKYLDCNTGC